VAALATDLVGALALLDGANRALRHLSVLDIAWLG
jgi:hypothetical protein